MKIRIIACCLSLVTLFFSCKKEVIGNINNGNYDWFQCSTAEQVLVDKQSLMNIFIMTQIL